MQFKTAQAIYDQTGGSRKGLPAWTYNNEELTQLEMERVFLRNWIWAGHVSDIPEVGDYQCLDIANERALVIRDQQGQVRAFHNLCRHRGSRVVTDSKGQCKNALVCPFHGWSYHLDGRLKNVPKSAAFPEFDKSRYGLKTLECEIWHGLIFIRFVDGGPSIAEVFHEAEQEVGLYRIGEMQAFDEPWRFDFKLDWKSVLDVDNEGYHVPIGHPELFDLVGASYQDQALESGLSRAHGSFRDRRHRTPLIQSYVSSLPAESYLPASHQHLWIYWGAFPGFVISLFPDMVEIYQVYPTGFQKSVIAGSCYALADDRTTMQAAREFNRQINMGVGNEDIQLIEWSAQGMRSSAFDGVLLSDLELGIGAFQNQLRQVLPVVSLDRAPEGGNLARVNEKMLNQAMRAQTQVADVA